MYFSITLIHSSAMSFRPGSTKCNEGAMSQAPMMPEAITPHVVSVCDAVNCSGVSSSSSASIFEVLRDNQILGSDTLQLSGTGEKMTMFPQAEECSKMCRKPDSTFNWRLGLQCCAPAEDCEKTCAETMADPNRSSCSDGWAARAAGRRNRRTRRRRGGALLEQLASACQRIVSIGEET